MNMIQAQRVIYPSFGGAWSGKFDRSVRIERHAAELVRVGKTLRLKVKEKKGSTDWLDDGVSSLTVRARNVLADEGFGSIAELRAALAAGFRLKNIPNCGKLTEREILHWLNQPMGEANG
jgi:hypothetical protein